MHESILQIYLKCIHKLSPINKSNMVISLLKSPHYYENLKERRSWDADVDTGKSSTFTSHNITLECAKRKNCHRLMATKSKATWQLASELVTNLTKESTARQEGNTVQS